MGNTVASDTFHRSNASSWGTASDGTNAWTQAVSSSVSGGAASWAILNNGGEVTNTFENVMLCGSSTQGDTEVLAQFYFSNTTSTWNGAVARSSSDGKTCYQCIHSANTLGLYRRNGANYNNVLPTALATFSQAITTGRNWIRFRVTGSSTPLLQARLWQDGTAEPTSWQVSYTDSSGSQITAAGLFGVYMSPSSTTNDLIYAFSANNTTTAANALTVWLANAASATLSTANQLYTGGAASPSTNQTISTVGTSTGFGEVYAQGNAGAWGAAGSLIAQSGHGFFLDASTLDGGSLAAGSYAATVRYVAMQGVSQAGTLVADLYVRVSKYSGGSYTTIATLFLKAQTINNVLANYILMGVTDNASDTSFAAGDRLYIDYPVNVVTNANAQSTQGIRINRLSTDTTAFTGDVNAQVVFTGYATAGGPTNNNMASTDALTVSEVALFVTVALSVESATVTDLGGNLQSWSLDVLSADDSSTLFTEMVQPADALTSVDSLLCTDSAPSLEMLSASDIGALQTWNVDTLSATDSTLFADAALPTESLTVGDTLIVSDTYAPTESATASESVSYTALLASTEPLAIAESLLGTDTYQPLDALTVADFLATGGITNNAMSAEDDLVISESALIVDVAIPTEVLSILDPLLATDGAAVTDTNTVSDSGALQAWPVESLSVSETVLFQESALVTEANAASDTLLAMGAASATVSLSVSDVSSYGSQLSDTGSSPSSESLLELETFLPVDALIASDLLTTGSVTNNAMTFGDDLTATDSLASTKTALPVDALVAAEQLLQADTYLSIEAITTTSSGTASGGYSQSEASIVSESASFMELFIPLEANLVASQAAASDSYISSEVQSVVGSFLSVDGTTWSELAPASDSSTMVQQAVGSVFLEVLSVADMLTATDGATWLEIQPISDSLSTLVPASQTPIIVVARCRDGRVVARTA